MASRLDAPPLHTRSHGRRVRAGSRNRHSFLAAQKVRIPRTENCLCIDLDERARHLPQLCASRKLFCLAAQPRCAGWRNLFCMRVATRSRNGSRASGIQSGERSAGVCAGRDALPSPSGLGPPHGCERTLHARRLCAQRNRRRVDPCRRVRFCLLLLQKTGARRPLFPISMYSFRKLRHHFLLCEYLGCRLVVLARDSLWRVPFAVLASRFRRSPCGKQGNRQSDQNGRRHRGRGLFCKHHPPT